MNRTKNIIAVVALIGAGALTAGTVFAHGAQSEGQNGGTGPAGMMNGQGPNQGMMGSQQQGMAGQAMMRAQGMMSSMMGGRGNHEGGCDGAGVAKLATPLTVKDVTAQLEKRLEWRGNKRLKVGKVEMTKDKNIVAEIVTVDGSLVRKIEVDPSTGMRHPVN